MKKSTLLAGSAVFLYATENVILERYLSSVPPSVLMMLFYPVIILLALLKYLFIGGEQFALQQVLPVSGIILMNAAILFFADFFFFSAYHHKGTVAEISTIVAFFPVTALVIKLCLTGILPTGREFLGCLLVPVVVWLVSSNK